jgi:predicted Fe-Mo cluster-binding NifX family protein
MKVAFASDGDRLESMLSQSFGRANYFLIYNIKDFSVHVEINPFNCIFEGAGIQSSQFLIGQNCHAVVTSQIGNNALRFLLSANIRVYRGVSGSIQNNLDMLIGNNLVDFENPGFNKSNEKGKRKRCRRRLKLNKTKK